MGNTRLGPLVNSEVRLFDEEEAISASCELVPGGTHSQQSLEVAK